VLWIRTAIKLPHDLGVCHKTVIHSDFFMGGGMKNIMLKIPYNA